MNNIKSSEEDFKILEARKKFCVIKGRDPQRMRRIFKSAYITDSRLMGVVCLYICWDSDFQNDRDIMHQFFYYDFEEYGFDTYKSLFGKNPEDLKRTEQTLIGGLGGKKIPISEKEACFLIKSYIANNESRGLPVPAPSSETDFICSGVGSLTDEEYASLFRKMCVAVDSDFELINYFLMRVFAKDMEGAEFLSCPGLPLSLYDELAVAAFCKNIITVKEDSFVCESLLEAKGIYYIAISSLKLSDLKVSEFERVSFFKITHTEAAMMLTRPEYISVYELYTDDETFIRESFSDVMDFAIPSRQEDGTLYIVFNRNNDHVGDSVFMLNSDVFAIVYISDLGELILASYKRPNISTVELLLNCSPLAEYTYSTGKFEFKEQILYEFIHSGLDYFEDFLEFLKE